MEEVTLFIREIITSQLFLLVLTIVTYYGANLLYKRCKIIIFTPILSATAAVIIFLKLADIEYQHYYESNSILNFLLGMSVVCFGYLMHKEIKSFNKIKTIICISTFLGSLVGVLSILGMSILFGYDEIITLSIEPKSVTMPIALSISDNEGGIRAITSLAVITAGIFGNVFGVQILNLFKINDPSARGLALGAASHAVGTARAVELGALQGAVAGASIGIVGLFTSIIIPIINTIKNLP